MAAANPNPNPVVPVVPDPNEIVASFETFNDALLNFLAQGIPRKGTDFLSAHGVASPIRKSVLESLDRTTAAVINSDCGAADGSQRFYFYRASRNHMDFLRMYGKYSEVNQGIRGLLGKLHITCGVASLKKLTRDQSQKLVTSCQELTIGQKINLYQALLKEVGLVAVVRGGVEGSAISVARQLCALGCCVYFTDVGFHTEQQLRELLPESRCRLRLSPSDEFPRIDIFVDSHGSGATQLGLLRRRMTPSAVIVDASPTQTLAETLVQTTQRFRLISAPPLGLASLEEEAEVIVSHVFRPFD